MTVMLLTENNLEFLSLIGGYTGSSESTLVKIPQCWRLHAATNIYHTGKCIRRFGGIYAYCRYFIDRKW